MNLTKLIQCGLISLWFSASAVQAENFRIPPEPDEAQELMHSQHERPHHQGFDRMFAKLDLSAAQRDSLKALRAGQKENREATHDKMFELKQQLRQVLDANEIDENKVRELSMQIADIKADQAIQHAKMKKQAMAILTDEQKAQLKSMKKKQIKRMKRKLEMIEKS